MEMVDALQLVSGSPWTYAVVLAVAAIDAVFPLVPSEATAIAAGVLAGAGELSIFAVIAAAAAGAFIGDNGSYLVGRRFGTSVTTRLLRGARGRRGRERAERALRLRGGYVIVVARFVPGGRTAATLTAGLTAMRWRRFARLAGLAAAFWASYAGLLGYLGGRTFEDDPWRGLLLALVLAGAVVLGVEGLAGIRRSRSTRRA
jgi:membrane protein DedA with SNARE-associated domain